LEIAESTYGSDKAGLVYGYMFAPGRPGRLLDSEEAAAFLAREPAADPSSFVWLHFNVANAASERWLRDHFSPPEAFLESLHDATSTRVEQDGDSLVAVLNDVRFFAFDVSNVSAVSLWVERRILVSARVTALRSVDRLRAAVKAGEIFRSPAELLAHLLRDQGDVLVQIVRDATKDVDVIEDRLIADREAFSRAKLGSLRRVLVRLRRLLAPEPAALFRLLSRPPTWISSEDLRDLRQSAEELSVGVADAAALAERIRLIQEEMVALVNEQTNRTLFVLTVVTVLALPLTIIPGLFGMNIGGIPFREHDAGFWIVVVLLAVFVSLGATLVFRIRRNS
jgi:zinc transporter